MNTMTYRNISELLLEDEPDGGNNPISVNMSDLELKNHLNEIERKIAQRKLKWQQKFKEVETKLRTREGEIEIKNKALEDKGRELDLIKKSLTRSDHIIKDLQDQIAKLKSEKKKVLNDVRAAEKLSATPPPPSPPTSPSPPPPAQSQPQAQNMIKTHQNHHHHHHNPPPQSIPISLSSTLKSVINGPNGTTSDVQAELNQMRKQMDRNERENQDLRKKNHELKKKGDELRKRDEYIRNLEMLEKESNIELRFVKDELKKYQRQELELKTDLEKHKRYYEEALKRIGTLEEENEKMLRTAKESEDRVKSELDRLSTKLSEKNEEIKSLNHRVRSLESQLKQRDEQLLEKDLDLQIANAYVNGLNLENGLLRIREKRDDHKTLIRDLQKRYHDIITQRENENERLRRELMALRETMLEKELTQSKEKTKSWTYKDVANEVESRVVNRLKTEYQNRIDDLKEMHSQSTKRLLSELEKVCGEKEALAAELNRASHGSPKISLTESSTPLSTGRLSSSFSRVDSGDRDLGYLVK